MGIARRQRIAFDWFVFIPTLLAISAFTGFKWIRDGKVNWEATAWMFIALMVVSILSGLENRIERLLKRVEELEKKSTL